MMMARPEQARYFNEPIEKQLGYAASVQTGNTIRLAGVMSVDEAMNVVGAGSMAAQISRVYDIIEQTLAMSGATLANVVREIIFTTDIAGLAAPEAGAARTSRYSGCTPPAATAVQVSGLFAPEALIEIQVTAVLDD
jgi:enamine deaminase RidA (YjgF/YER057c/UK114 family)